MSSHQVLSDEFLNHWLSKLALASKELSLPSKVFVTGGSGFVGGYLLRALVHLGVETVAIGRSDKSCQAVESCGAQSVLGALDDPNCLAEALVGCDGVVHCAARKNGDEFSDYLRDNVEATQMLLNRAAKAGVKRFVNLSTGSLIAALARPPIGIDEQTSLPLAQWSPYLHSKGLAEQAVMKANGNYGMATLSLRPCLIWGENAPFNRNIVEVSKGPLGFVVTNNGEFPYSTVHVFNVIEALVQALGHSGMDGESAKLAGGTWFVNDPYPNAHPNGLPWREFLSRMQTSLNVPTRMTSLPRWMLMGGAKAADDIVKSLRDGKALNAETGVRLFTQSLAPSDEGLRANSAYKGLVGIEEAISLVR